MARSGLRLKGLKEMNRTLSKAPKRVDDELAGALYEEAETVMGKAKRITPVDTGNLRASGRVTPPDIERMRIVVNLLFGGPSASYAAIVHERTEVWHRPPTQAKFLEEPLMESVRGMADRLARRMDLRRVFR